MLDRRSALLVSDTEGITAMLYASGHSACVELHIRALPTSEVLSQRAKL